MHEVLTKLQFHFPHNIRFILGLAFLALLTLAPLPIARADDGDDPGQIVRRDGVRFDVPTVTTKYLPSHRAAADTSKLVNTKTSNKKLPALGGKSIESVIGPDGRKQVSDTTKFPNSAIAFLEVYFPGGSGSCTGWFIDATRLVTAAHCLYDSSFGGFAIDIDVYPGRNGIVAPYGIFSADDWFVPSKWINTQSPKFDYGVIALNTNIGDTVGWFGVKPQTESDVLLNRNIKVRGYPGDKNYGTQWNMNGPIQKVNNSRFFYSIDTFGGQSGSPAFGKYGKDCNPCAFGVHTYGVGGGWTQNSASRITSKAYNFIATAGLPLP